MLGRVSPTLVQGVLGRKQARQRRLAQSAQPTRGAVIGHEVRRLQAPGLLGSHPARRPKVANVRKVHFVAVSHGG